MKTIPELKTDINNYLETNAKISEEFCYKVTQLLYLLYQSKMKLMNNKDLKNLCFDYGYCYLLYDINNMFYREPTNKVVDFIKKYGNFNGNYYDNFNMATIDNSKYLFHKGQIEPRFNLLKNAIENYQTAMGITPERKLTTKEQIDCLLFAKEHAERHYLVNCSSSNGICLALRMAISRKIDKFIDYEKCYEYIPLFTFENAQKFCRKLHYKMPNENLYWWDRDNIKIRVAFINWMISELKN